MNQGPLQQHQGYQQQRKQIRNEREALATNIQQAAIEQNTTQSYRPPAVTQCSFLASSMNSESYSPSLPYRISRGNRPLTPQPKPISYVTNPSDGSILLDHNNKPVSVDKLLATKPLRKELSTRPGPGNKKLTYISGDGISRTLNDIFGFDGWNLDIIKVERVESLQNQGKHTVIYTAHVRLTHKASGTYKEDVGMGDSTDRSFATAVGHAIKASITDAMKRAARHFGDKLGNSLYESSFNINNAPKTLQEALDRHDIERCKSKFGFPKDRKPNDSNGASSVVATSTAAATAPANNTSAQARPTLGGENKSIVTNPATMVSNQNQAAPNQQGSRVPLSNLSANAKSMSSAPQQQQGNPAKPNFPFAPMPTSKPLPPGHQQARQPAPSVPQRGGYQQQCSGNSMRQGAPSGTSNNAASMNRYNGNTAVPQNRNTYISKESTAPANAHATSVTLPIGPPPTATDTLKNSNLFSYPSQPSQPIVVANGPHPTIAMTAPPSRKGRFSMDGQRPIQQVASLVTPSNQYSNSVQKRPNDFADPHSKRPCRPNNPYATSN